QLADWFQRHRAAVTAALGGTLPPDWLDRPAHELIDPRTTTCPPSFRAHRDDIAAAMTALALADNKGPNLAVIQSYTAHSVERLRPDFAATPGTKARNRPVLRSPAPAGGLFSFAGILEFVTAATRVERHLRPGDADFKSLLFVPTGRGRVAGIYDVGV